VNGTRRKVHFVGVGGIGMSGLAEILLNLGYSVSGSDLHASDITRRLETYGLRFFEGHDSAHTEDADILVVSAAVPQDNAEVADATRRGLPIWHRAELLADLVRLKPNAVVVGGSHGKTTTTSMISAILDRANIGATSIIGGILQRSGTNARWGTGEYIVAEADEHDGSFLRLHPTVAVVTNIDAEHLEYYGTIDAIQRAFVEFCNGVPFFGNAILCADDANTREVLDRIHSNKVTYGMNEGANLRAVDLEALHDAPSQSLARRIEGLRMRFQVYAEGEVMPVSGHLGALTVRTLGDDNVRNALAACAVGISLGMPFGLIADGLAEFSGVRRRMQLCGEVRGAAVIEDYAHHPTELASALSAVRVAEPGRILCVFQPHLYSRTKYFSAEFAAVLASADFAIVTDIYASREAPLPGVDAGLIVDAAHADGHHHVELLRDKYDVPARLASTVQSGDVVLLLGAGDINTVAPAILKALEAAA